MGRFSRIDFEGEPSKVAVEPLDDPWPNLDEHACLRQGDAQFATGLYEAALASYSRALRFDRDLDAAWVGQIRCLICLGEYPEAILWSDRGLERMRNAPELLAGKGLALVLRGDGHDGMAYLDGAVEMRSPSPWVWLARGEGLLALGMPEANAHRCFLKAMELAPRDPHLQLRIGIAYNRARRWARARGPLLAAERADGDNPLALYHAGLAHEGLGEWDRAAGFYERALAARKPFPDAEQALYRVRHTGPLKRVWRKIGGSR